MKKVCFNGCSFTVGEGFPVEQRDQYIYDRLVAQRFGLERTNIAEGGSSNHEIFMRSCRALYQDFDTIFVQWSVLNRMWFYPGPDTEFFLNDGYEEYHYRDIRLDKRTKQKLIDMILLLNHDYHQIFQLIDYCSILDRLAEHHGKNVIYINGLVPWTDDLVKPLTGNLTMDLSQYTKEILDFDHRDDAEIQLFFERLSNKFQELDRSKWVNLFDSFIGHQIDIGPQGHHPGPQSHVIMADKISDFLLKNGLVAQ